MSLKAFHVLFVLISTMGSLGFGAWAIRDYMHTDKMGSAVIGGLSFLGAVVLVVYGFWFLKKLKGVSWL